MAIRKSVEEEMVVPGSRKEWLTKCATALTSQGFTNVTKHQELFQVEASYKKITVWGSIQITLTPAGSDTKITARSTANVDNIYALLKSPNKTILSKFKEGLR